MKLSEKIIHLRKERGWSQEQLAIKLDVSRQAVYKWEADINQPDLEKLKRISAIFLLFQLFVSKKIKILWFLKKDLFAFFCLLTLAIIIYHLACQVYNL